MAAGDGATGAARHPGWFFADGRASEGSHYAVGSKRRQRSRDGREGVVLTLLERIAQRLQLDPPEARRALALALLIGGIMASYTLTKTARDAFFLAELPATTLPYVYLGIGLVASVTAAAFTRLTWRMTPARSLGWVSIAGAAMAGLFALLTRLDDPRLPVALYVWVNVYGLVLVSQFWLFANTVSHAREAKRTFGIVGLGGIVGGLLGGIVAAPLAMAGSLTAILLVAGVLQAFVVPGVFAMRPNVPAPDPLPAEAAPPAHPLKHRYVRWLALGTLCSVVAGGVVDYQFKVALQQRFADPGALAGYLGQFYALGNLAAIVVQVFLTRWMIERLGASWSTIVLPTGLALGSVATLFAPGVLATTVTRLWDHVARMSVTRPAVELFYFPLEPGIRRRAKSMIDAGLERLGDALAGLLILGVAFVAGGGTRTLAVTVLAIGVVWMVAWWGVRRGYVRELGRNLKRMNLQPSESRVSLREAALLSEMVRLLSHPFERLVLLGIDMLLEHSPATLDEHVRELLLHPSATVRSRALELVRERRLEQHREAAWSLIDDPDDEVRVQAMATQCALEGGDILSQLEEFLASPSPRLRRAAIAATTEHASPAADAVLAARLGRLLEHGSVEDRRAVAEALGRRAPPSAAHELFPRLLRDPDLEVRRATLRSAGRVGRRGDVPALLDALAHRPTQDAARAGLVAMGDRVVGTLGDYLADPTVALELRQLVPRVLGEMPTQDAVNALMRVRDVTDARLDYRILKAANRIRSSGERAQFPREHVTAAIERDAQAHLFALVHYRACPIGTTRTPERMLCIVLNERMEQSLNRVFRRLALLYPPQEMLAAYRGAISDSARRRGDALEYLENLLAPEHRAVVMPLVDDRGDEGRLAFARARHGFVVADFDRTLTALLEHGDPWLRACALFVVGRRRDAAMLPLVQSNLEVVNGLVRETAAWARLAILGG